MGGGQEGDYGGVNDGDDGGGEGKRKKTTLPSLPFKSSLAAGLNIAYLSVSFA